VQQHGNAITVIGPAELERWRQKTSALDGEWQKEVSAKGFDGKKLLDGARALIARQARPK
jgi:TRAP-type transport system periplasmic protein